jgi:hypothetical protein
MIKDIADAAQAVKMLTENFRTYFGRKQARFKAGSH